MKFDEPSNPPGSGEANLQSVEGTGLPGFRTWGSVYAVVAASYVVWVFLLVALYQMFS